MKTKPIEQQAALVCNLNALDREDRERHARATERILQQVQLIRELPDGLAFRFPNDTTLLVEISILIAYERLCCPFLGFGLEIESAGGAVWLSLTGQEGVKAIIRAELAGAWR